MVKKSIVKHQPLSLGDDCLVFKVGEEESICVYCKSAKCKGNCERLRTERKKLKASKK